MHMWTCFHTVDERIGYFWEALAAGESSIEGTLLIQSCSHKAIEIWMAWPTAPPWTWNLNRPGVFIEVLFLAHRLWHCTHAQSRHKHTHADMHTYTCTHGPLKPAVVTPCMYQPFLGAHVGGNAEQEINMLKKRRAQGAFDFYRFLLISRSHECYTNQAIHTVSSSILQKLLTFRSELIGMMGKYSAGQKCQGYGVRRLSVWRLV